jgi:hypothetical protein
VLAVPPASISGAGALPYHTNRLLSLLMTGPGTAVQCVAWHSVAQRSDLRLCKARRITATMPTFNHKRTGRTITVPPDQAHQYSDERRWTPVSNEPQSVQLRVPDGSVAEVLDWAGDDPDRRAAALAAEKAGKGRVTLIRALDQT